MNPLNIIKSKVDIVTGVDISKNVRDRIYVDGRKIYSYIARNKTRYSLDTIGEVVNKKHCSISHYLKRTPHHINNEYNFRALYQECEKLIPVIQKEHVLKERYNFHLNKARDLMKEIKKIKSNEPV